MKYYSLIFIFNGNRVLMLNRFNSPAKGTWCGVGGTLEPGETMEECAARELFEETGLKVNLTHVGEIDIVTEDAANFIFYGTTTETPQTRTFEEGILSLLPISFVLDPRNEGVNRFTKKALTKALGK